MERYLRTAEGGIFVLGYYKCDTWDVPDDWRRDASLHRFKKEEAENNMKAELKRLQGMTDKRLAAFFLDASL